MKKLILTIGLIMMLMFSQVAFAAPGETTDGVTFGSAVDEIEITPENEEAASTSTAPAQSIIVPPRIVKPDLLPGPSQYSDAEDVHERYFVTRLIPTLVRGAINLLGGITVIALMWGGIQYLTAYGDETKIGNAKNAIVYAIVGLLIAIFSYTIVQIISEVPLNDRTERVDMVPEVPAPPAPAQPPVDASSAGS